MSILQLDGNLRIEAYWYFEDGRCFTAVRSSFYQPAILPFFNQCEDAEMDGTFKPAPQNPKGVKQIFVTTVFIRGRVSELLFVRILYSFFIFMSTFVSLQAYILSIVLCSGIRQSLYKIILQDLRNKACSVTSLPSVGKRMHCDYDIAAMNAFLEFLLLLFACSIDSRWMSFSSFSG